LVNEEVTPHAEVSEKVELLLEESKRVVHDELPEGLPPIKNIPPHIDLISGASLSNLSHYRINSKETETLKNEDFKKI